jgi:hypothetical protein
MTFYNDKVLAFELIDQLCKKGLSDEVIVYTVTSRFGFSENMILKRIGLLRRLEANIELAENITAQVKVQQEKIKNNKVLCKVQGAGKC